MDNSIQGEYGQNVVDARKHLYDKLRFDSTIEKTLAGEMDIADEVELYVKLLSGFYINTPMGKYNPDWAIVFNEELKESSSIIKHIYFVAETKGSLETLQLRGVEGAKIECARRHFAAISGENVKYDVIDSFENLMEKLR